MALPSSRILSRARSPFSLLICVVDIEKIVLIFEARLQLERQLLRGDLKLEGGIGQDDQRLATFHVAPSSTNTCFTVPP
jgi:hypothetical protein